MKYILIWELYLLKSALQTYSFTKNYLPQILVDLLEITSSYGDLDVAFLIYLSWTQTPVNTKEGHKN
jgi:hypothetical protein